MRRVLFVLLVSCGVKLGDQGSAKPASDAGAKDAQADAIVGLACGRDPITRAELCSGINVCPNLLVDPDAFPACGFLPGTMDLACLCDNQLCTMGKPKSCAEAKFILANANVLIVCAAAAEGTCKLAK